LRECRRAEATIPSHGYFLTVILPEIGPDSLAQQLDRFLGEVFVDDSSYVILSENFRIDIHLFLLRLMNLMHTGKKRFLSLYRLSHTQIMCVALDAGTLDAFSVWRVYFVPSELSGFTI
jgi:hypothetical protein